MWNKKLEKKKTIIDHSFLLINIFNWLLLLMSSIEIKANESDPDDGTQTGQYDQKDFTCCGQSAMIIRSWRHSKSNALDVRQLGKVCSEIWISLTVNEILIRILSISRINVIKNLHSNHNFLIKKNQDQYILLFL